VWVLYERAELMSALTSEKRPELRWRNVGSPRGDQMVGVLADSL
jgi:hypothetical protein